MRACDGAADAPALAASAGNGLRVADTTEEILDACVRRAVPGDHLLVMSNGAFEDLPGRLVRALEAKYGKRSPDAAEAGSGGA